MSPNPTRPFRARTSGWSSGGAIGLVPVTVPDPVPMVKRLESGTLQQRVVLCLGEVAPVHGGPEEAVLDVARVRRTGKREQQQQPARPQPASQTPEKGGLLGARQVEQRVDHDRGVEALRPERQGHDVGVHEPRARHVPARALDLTGGDVDADDREALGQGTGDRDAAAAADVEHRGSAGQLVGEKRQPVRRRRRPRGGVCLAAPVVAARHEGFGIEIRIVHRAHPTLRGSSAGQARSGSGGTA